MPSRAARVLGSRRLPRPGRVMSRRAVVSVRRVIGERIRGQRKAMALSQARLGDRAGLSGKFIGEVERGEKSISVDSLYRVARALGVRLTDLTDLGGKRRRALSAADADKMFALLSSGRPDEVRRALQVLKTLFRAS